MTIETVIDRVRKLRALAGSAHDAPPDTQPASRVQPIPDDPLVRLVRLVRAADDEDTAHGHLLAALAVRDRAMRASAREDVAGRVRGLLAEMGGEG